MSQDDGGLGWTGFGCVEVFESSSSFLEEFCGLVARATVRAGPKEFVSGVAGGKFWVCLVSLLLLECPTAATVVVTH